MPNVLRPDPDQLLKSVETAAQRARRGQLKIFFGSSAGVGKTYAMLQAAQAHRREDLDVAVGLVETHNRPETKKLLHGLEVLPRRTMEHKGVQLEEFDLDAALARKPALLIVDELAHNNAPGMRHPKRWQDVEELLDAGIDVYTTLNVQHLESLNDVVASITGITVQETVPDNLFDEATDVQLVDLPPEELLERLAQGKLYLAEGAAARAAQNFFNKTNLMSLRELALRRTAEHVDADTDQERIQAGLFTPNNVGDRVLVCIGPDTLAPKVVRTGRRMAASLKAPWYVLAVETSKMDKTGRGYQLRQRALRIAEQNGAQVITLQSERPGDAILEFARNKGITKLIIGRSIRPIWVDYLRGFLVEHIIRHSGEIDIYIITGKNEARRKPLSWNWGKPSHYVWAFFLLSLCTSAGLLIRNLLQPVDILMLYLIGAVIAAARLGRLPSLLFTFLSVIAFNFFFVEPIYSLEVYNSAYWPTFAVMLATSLVISTQAGRLRQQTLHAQRRERETQTLYALTRELAAARNRDTIIAAAIKHISETMGGNIAIWLRQKDGLSVNGVSVGDPVKEEIVAQWSYDHRQPAGLGTNTLPSAQNYYYPLQNEEKIFGVLAIAPPDDTEILPNDKSTIEAFAHLITTALERVFAAREAEQTRLQVESEKLRNTFLSSMSHDLRTPLATIKGAADTLRQSGESLTHTARGSLFDAIHQEASRLSRVMNNVLDLTRLERGKLALNEQPYFIQELIGATVSQMRAKLSKHQVIIEIPEYFPLVKVDGLLIEQVMQNLLENAVNFSDEGCPIRITAARNLDGLQISVIDDGVGLPRGQEKQIFDKFFTMGQKDKPKGTGLGLAICQAIIHAHGGHIWAEDNIGGGAALHFTLPASRIMKDPDA